MRDVEDDDDDDNDDDDSDFETDSFDDDVEAKLDPVLENMRDAGFRFNHGRDNRE